MKIWDIAVKTHDVMAHTGFLLPHGEQRYADNGELRLPNEIDLPLITLGQTVDATFLAALADAIDPFGNLDTDTSLIVGHSVHDPNYPYYPVLQYKDGGGFEDWEFHRPWAYPNVSEHTTDGTHNTHVPTPTETYDPSAADPNAVDPNGSPIRKHRPMRPGPYREGTTPDQVFFRTNVGPDVERRAAYEKAQTPWETDQINEGLLKSRGRSPLGDPVPFSAYLVGQLTNPTGYSTQFNLDADRAYAYLTWDWIRGDQRGTTELGFNYDKPEVAPWLDRDEWDLGVTPMKLHYVDPPTQIIIGARPDAGPAASATPTAAPTAAPKAARKRAAAKKPTSKKASPRAKGGGPS
jgi:hypothetical protein